MSTKTKALGSLKLIIAKLMVGLVVATVTTICFLIWSDYNALTNAGIFIGTTALAYYLVIPAMHLHARVSVWLENNITYFQMKANYKRYPELHAIYNTGKKNKFDYWTQ